VGLSLLVFSKGALLSFGLILAIGAQNAFVLRQGLRGEHVFLVCGCHEFILGVLLCARIRCSSFAACVCPPGGMALAGYGCCRGHVHHGDQSAARMSDPAT